MGKDMEDGIGFYRLIDSGRLKTVVTEAQASGDFSGRELGELCASVCKRVVCSSKFAGYSGDWKCDMFGNACVAALNAVRILDTSKSGRDIFNYVYTAALNACKRAVTRLHRISDPLAYRCDFINGEAVLIRMAETAPDLPAKRNVFRDYFKNRAKEIALRVNEKRYANIGKVIRIQATAVAEGIGADRLEGLLNRNNGERHG